MGKNNDNKKTNKKIRWLIIAIIAIILLLLILGLIMLKPKNVPLEEDKSGESISGEYNDTILTLSGEYYIKDEEKNTISIDKDIGIEEFILSDSEDGPTSGDIWIKVDKEKPTEIPDSEIHKKYVHYKGVSVDQIGGGSSTIHRTDRNAFNISVHCSFSGTYRTPVMFPAWSGRQTGPSLPNAGQHPGPWAYGADWGNGWWGYAVDMNAIDSGSNIFHVGVHCAQGGKKGDDSNVAELAHFTIYCDDSKPKISNCPPTTIYTTDGKVTLSCDVTDSQKDWCSGINRVEFPTWSGGNAATWHRVDGHGDGRYTVTLDLASHSPGKAGYEYLVDIYATDNFGLQSSWGRVHIYWRHVLTIPSINGTYTYDGTTQTVSLNNFDPNIMNINNNTRKNAGSQNVTVSLKNTTYYQWSDGTTGEKTLNWTINKQVVNPVTNLKVSPEGIVTWTNSSNATGYLISIDGNNWLSATSGIDYSQTITAVKGERTVYVQAINSDQTNYINSEIKSATVTVYTLTLNKGTGVLSVTGAGNYIKNKVININASLDTGYMWKTWDKATGTYPANAGVVSTTVTINADTILKALTSSYYEVNGEPYPTLAKSYSAITGNSGTIKAVRDNIQDNSVLVVSTGKNIVIDTNGKTIVMTNTSVNGGIAINNRGTLEIKGNGTITTLGTSSNKFAVLIKTEGTGSNGVLVINNMNLIHKGSTQSAGVRPDCVIYSNTGNITLNNSQTLLQNDSGISNLNVGYAIMYKGNPNQELNVNGGRVYSNNKNAIYSISD